MPLGCSTLQLINPAISLSSEQRFSFTDSHSPVIFGWRLREDQHALRIYKSTNGRAIRVLAINAVSGKRNSKKEIIMVDPLEAKKLAAKQMQQIKAKERLKLLLDAREAMLKALYSGNLISMPLSLVDGEQRRRQIEAINGAWAMIGLTAGLVIEGETGKGILAQLAGYWAAIIGLVFR